MKKLISVIIFAFFQVSTSFADDIGFSTEEECEMNRFYLNAAATIVLPGGDSDMRRLGGGTARCGYYFSDFWAVEAEIASLENNVGFAGAVLWHWWGYERFDPFFTFGAKGWTGRGNSQIGPKIGTGCFYHLTDSWALRFDADFTLDLESDNETIYTVSAGFQYSF